MLDKRHLDEMGYRDCIDPCNHELFHKKAHVYSIRWRTIGLLFGCYWRHLFGFSEQQNDCNSTDHDYDYCNNDYCQI